ncbi:MAG: DUF5702 domain-containing protein [Bacillota bacterium]
MCRIGFSKKGSTSVFLTMILASVIFAVSVFIYQASQLAGESYADAVLELAGRSILSEYDIQLQKRYGIFAVHTNESQTEEKIKYYADYSFHDNALKEVLRKRRYMDILKLDLESLKVNLKGYSITDIDLFEKQILDSMKTNLIESVLKEEMTVSQRKSDIVLKNQQVIHGLPSYGYSKNSLDIKKILDHGIPDLNAIREKGTNDYFVNEYIMGHFFDHANGTETRNTFFINEVEYILAGNYNDQENYKDVRKDLLILRTGLNLAHIYSDSIKRNETAVLAEIITPGPEAILTQAVINGIWAAAEAENDLRRLEDGKQVPLVKNRQQWAISLENAVQVNEEKQVHSKNTQSGYIEPMNKTGVDYESYLRILLFFQNREIKLLRCLDLIQLNMKGSYYKDFDLKEYYGGFQFDAVVSGKTYTYVQKY